MGKGEESLAAAPRNQACCAGVRGGRARFATVMNTSGAALGGAAAGRHEPSAGAAVRLCHSLMAPCSHMQKSIRVPRRGPAHDANGTAVQVAERTFRSRGRGICLGSQPQRASSRKEQRRCGAGQGGAFLLRRRMQRAAFAHFLAEAWLQLQRLCAPLPSMYMRGTPRP